MWRVATVSVCLALAAVGASAQSPTEVLAQIDGNGPLATRPHGSLQALFGKGTVNGSELVTELIALRAHMSRRRSAQAVGALLGSDPPSGAKGIDPQGELIKLALKSAEEAVKPYVVSVGFGALDLHLRTIIEDPQLLGSDSIKLPSSRDMSHVQAQRVINMAAIVVATRVTGRLLAKAQADFANDLGAQNLALRDLRKSDPSAWEQYKARSDGARSITKGYIRATAGVTAFAALLASFGQETLGAMRQKKGGEKGGEIVLALPFAWEFIKEVPCRPCSS